MNKKHVKYALTNFANFLYGKSSFDYALEQSTKKRTHSFNCLIVHTDPNTSWAQDIKRELIQTFPSIMSGVELMCKTKLITGGYADVKDQLHEELDLSDITGSTPYSFIITVGTWESELILRIREHSHITIPQIHCTPSAPLNSEPPFSSVRNKCAITGVYSHPTSPDEYVSGLLGIAPHVKTVCIVFDDNDNDDENEFIIKHNQRRELKNAFKAANIQTISHYWSFNQPRLIELEVETRVIDAMLLPDSPTTHANITEIRQIASRNKVIVCSSELDSVIKGASIGAGIVRSGFAAPLMSLMVDIILANEIASVAPIKIPQQSGLRYNFEAMKEQGITISPQLSSVLRMKSVFDKDITEY